ncbi:MAG: twin arginine-targeting protein translocase TatC [Gammaproteobacteria bacterium 28-57-27]|nr:MAG: twin arginine-targeting protein translocase TatC [Gammaproteobacteria bacterium 28-57-27]
MPPLSEGMKAFIAHLIELRDRLLRAVLAVVVLMVVIFPWASELFTIFATPVLNSLPAGQTMIATGAISPFFIPIKLAALAAVFIAMPYILYQLWAFIAPGLYQHEKQLAMPLVVSSSVLFYVGAGFAYFIVIPAVFHFMAMFAPDGVSFMPDIGNYLDFAMGLFFTFGLAFEVPVAVVLLSMLGIVTPDQLAEKRRYAILVAFIIGAIFTPPDILSQFMLAIPVWMLYELGILVARVMVKNKAKQDEEESSYDDNEASPLLAAPAVAAALPAAHGSDLSADETSATPPADAAPTEMDTLPAQDSTQDTLDMDDEFARAEEDERRLNAGESLDRPLLDKTSPAENQSGTEHAFETNAQDDETPLIHRDDRATSLQEPSQLDQSDDDAHTNKPNP